MAEPISLDALATRAKDSFQQRFGRQPAYVTAAPGRVNLIGEHTDYNDGFVLPMAIDRYTVFAADTVDVPQGKARIYSATMDDEQQIALAGGDKDQLSGWAKYVRGVLDAFASADMPLQAFNAVCDSTVPLGGGLSSSAALEVSLATLLEAISGKPIDPIQKALLCQKAEHEGAGVPCGIMDQFSSVLCRAGHLMLLDCRSQEPNMVPLADPSIEVLIINSNVKHELTGGEYAERRSQCEAAAKALGVESLRDVTPAQLEEKRSSLEAILYRRARHVVGEIKRTTDAAAALEAGNWDLVGTLMYASHDSLRDDYQVSCPELDLLVETAHALGPDWGVIGSRMTGGGFGGCTVSLVKAEQSDDVANMICEKYHRKTGVQATAFATTPADGAKVLEAP